MFGVHSIIIPLNSSAWNHQVHNAEYFNKNFESDILNEDEELSLKLRQKLISYKNLRKAWLNLNKFYNALKIIEQNIK
jgi:UDP-N-acetylglucosamine:LPS N-acetylglucosamine transferase